MSGLRKPSTPSRTSTLPQGPFNNEVWQKASATTNHRNAVKEKKRYFTKNEAK